MIEKLRALCHPRLRRDYAGRGKNVFHLNSPCLVSLYILHMDTHTPTRVWACMYVCMHVCMYVCM